MSGIRKLERISFTTILAIAICITLVLTVLLSIFFMRQTSQDAKRQLSQQFSKPVEFPEKQIQPTGPVPIQPPTIGRVYPWVGKIGDVVWIQGKDFGDNPSGKALTIGGIDFDSKLEETHLISWLDDEIQVKIPEGAVQGGIVRIDNGTHTVAESLPYVLYDQSVQKNGVLLRKNENTISAEHAQQVRRATIWYGDEHTETTMKEVSVAPDDNGNVFITDTQGQPILTILLAGDNENEEVLSYYVNPSEFGF